MLLKSYQVIVDKSGKNKLKLHTKYEVEKQYLVLPDPQHVFDLLKSIGITQLAEEEVYMLACNTRGRLLGIFMVSHGTVDATLISPREIFLRALLIGASRIIVVHNHPSKDTTPSKEDIKVTKRIKEAGEIIGIKVLDHIIIGGGFTSFKEEGLL